MNNGNNRYFTTADDASIKTSQSALLSFSAGGKPGKGTAEPSLTGETLLYKESDAFPSPVQSGVISWRYNLKPGADPIKLAKLDPSTVAKPTISSDGRAFSVNFHLDASNPLPPPVHLATIDLPAVVPSINADVHLRLNEDAAGNIGFAVSGAHDGFPAYEILINHRLVYAYDPVAANSDPANLAGAEDVTISPTSGLISPQMELLTNGSFEKEAIRPGADFTSFTSLPGWITRPGSAALEVCRDGYRGPTGGDGHWLDTRGSPGGIDISQPVNVGTGTTAHLTASIAAASVTSPSEHLQFIFDGKVVKEISLRDFGIISPVLTPVGSLNTFKDFTVDVTGQRGPDTLEIKSVGASGSYGFSLDKVSLVTSGSLQLTQGHHAPGQLTTSELSAYT